MDLVLRPLSTGDLEGEVEVVEHKGLGHPDTMCDALAEAFGVALARFYLERFGGYFHFNVDKALLAGGQARPAFRGGEVIAPLRVMLAGRATREVGGVRVPIDEIAVETSRAWVRDNMHGLDPERHVQWSCLVGGGSADLVDLFRARGAERGAPWLANDTSIGAGYAPLSRLERVVLAAADRLRALPRSCPEVGEDVKVMGVRRRDRMHLTVACALLGGHLNDLDDYASRRGAVAREVQAAAQRVCDREVTVEVNAADDLAAGRAYITVTGTSAEAGDDGEVGRGNRVNGLITPYRPMSLEAAAGKNPASHVGKLYNVAAHRIAATVVDRVPEVAQAHCFLLSRIGRPVNDPVVADVGIRTRDGAPVEAVRRRVLEIVQEGVGAMSALADEILAGRVRLF
jgi:S-adenosylmethionine synthetase